MNELVASRKALINRIKEWRPERDFDPAIESIFYKANKKGLKGKTINELISSLFNREGEERQEKYYEEFRKEGETAIRQMIATRNRVLEQLMSGKPLLE